MLYSVISLGYLTAVSSFIQQNWKAYEQSRAPKPLKDARHALNMAASGFWYSLGLYTVFELSPKALADLLLLDDAAFDVLQQLPMVFSISYFAIQSAILAYKIYILSLYDKKTPVQVMNLITDILCFILEIFLYICVFSFKSMDWFRCIILVNVTLNLWKSVFDDIYEIYDRSYRGKKIDWDLLMTTLYMNLSMAILFTCILFKCLTLGDAVLDGLICLLAAFYLGVKTAHDFYQNPQCNYKKIAQILLFILQTTIGLAILTGVMVIPSTAIVSFMLFKILSTSNLFVAGESLVKKGQEQQAVHEKTKLVLNHFDTPNMSVKKYLFQYQIIKEQAKEMIWENQLTTFAPC